MIKDPRSHRHTLKLEFEFPKDSEIVVHPGQTADSPTQFVLTPVSLHHRGQGSGGIIVYAHADVVAGLGDDVIDSIRSSGVGSVSVAAMPGETVSMKKLGELADRTQRDVILSVRRPAGEGDGT
jgi:hypothetical protein